MKSRVWARSWLGRLSVLGVMGLSLGCQATTPEPSVMPLGTVRLYETGVGYFERVGVISDDGSDTLPVPASHVDDALKTLLVMSDGSQAQVAGVEFDSVMSRGLARSLAALPLDAEQEVSFTDVLVSLKGIEVEVEVAGELLRGRLIEVRPAPPLPQPAPSVTPTPREPASGGGAAPRVMPPDTEDDHYLTLVGEDGSVRRLRASQVTQVRPQDPALSNRLSAAASALSGRAAQIQRGLRVLATRGARVRLGYIAETPVWRATYRLVLAEVGSSARIEGWALIHNDTDEAWREVRVELVNGQPDSFLFPLSAPRYARRPLATPTEPLSTVPQLADRTPDQIWGDHAEDEGFSASGLGLAGFGSGGGGGRLGTRHGMGSVVTKPSTKESSEFSIGNLAEIAPAVGLEVGALFSYALPNQLNLRAHGSALVPFSSQSIEARRLTWFDDEGAGRSGVRIKNTSGQTLPAGPVSIYEGRAEGLSGFSGETGLPRLKPTERAFLRFGVDLDVELEDDHELKTEPREVPQKVRFEGGGLVVHFIRHHERGYVLKNRSGAARDVYVTLNVVKNAKVEGADELDYDLESERALAVFKAAPKAEVKRRLQLAEALRRVTPTKSLKSEQLTLLVKEDTLPEAERRVIEAAVPLLEAVERLTEQLTSAEREAERLKTELGRMREHLSALGDKGGAPAGANPLVVRILDLEDRLSRAERQVETLTTQITDGQRRVEEQLKRLGADITEPGQATP